MARKRIRESERQVARWRWACEHALAELNEIIQPSRTRWTKQETENRVRVNNARKLLADALRQSEGNES